MLLVSSPALKLVRTGIFFKLDIRFKLGIRFKLAIRFKLPIERCSESDELDERTPNKARRLDTGDASKFNEGWMAFIELTEIDGGICSEGMAAGRSALARTGKRC